MSGATDNRPASLSHWLALRQRADFAARSRALATRLLGNLPSDQRVRILDLGTGTGSNIRYLSPLIGREQDWLALDKDPRLLAEARDRSSGPGIHVETQVVDLATLDKASHVFDGRHLVTASALLDLVSAGWLEHVALECRRVRALALFTLTYNGRNECTPRDDDDEMVFALFNRHQLTDKGIGGVAAGPAATSRAAEAFRSAGYNVIVEPSDWHIGPTEQEFQRQLIEGWATAAGEIDPSQRPTIQAWTERRLAHVAAAHSRVVVGHWDLAALFR